MMLNTATLKTLSVVPAPRPAINRMLSEGSQKMKSVKYNRSSAVENQFEQTHWALEKSEACRISA